MRTPIVESHEQTLESFFARETGNPIVDAFPEKKVVHAGGKTRPMNPQQIDEAWQRLLERPRTGKTAAYIHVPFCESHCLYCGFYRKRYDASQSRAYADTLIAELSAHADSPMQNAAPIHAVYLGGGTPTSLEAEDLARILAAIRVCLPIANDCEITVEGRIWNFGPEKMEACLEGGANRFSLGVQTFDTALRQSMKRLSDRDSVIEALCRLRDYDQASVVIDLIYGFPNQTMAMWEQDIRTYLGLNLDGIDLYQLNIFPGTPLHKAIASEKMPAGIDKAGRAAMYARGVEIMDAAHYRRLSVNHWGRTSRERNIYNHMMKGPAHCLPFGPGAGGGVHGNFFFQETDWTKWQKMVEEEKRKPIVMMQAQGPNAVLEKTISSELELCRINLARIGRNFDLPIAETVQPLYAQWERAGLLRMNGEWAELTTAGQFWQVTMAQYTINYLNQVLFVEDS